MNLNESNKEYMGNGGTKEKREMMQLYYNLKYKRNDFKIVTKVNIKCHSL